MWFRSRNINVKLTNFNHRRFLMKWEIFSSKYCRALRYRLAKVYQSTYSKKSRSTFFVYIFNVGLFALLVMFVWLYSLKKILRYFSCIIRLRWYSISSSDKLHMLFCCQLKHLNFQENLLKNNKEKWKITNHSTWMWICCDITKHKWHNKSNNQHEVDCAARLSINPGYDLS